MSDEPGLFRTIYTTRALRRFKPDPVPDAVLFQCFDAAIRASSGQNAQDWRWIIIRDAAIKAKLREWAVEGWERYSARYGSEEDIRRLPRNQRLSLLSVRDLALGLDRVPVIVAVLGMKGRHSTPGGSTFPAVQNFQLAARAMGLGSSIFNLPMREQLYEMLGIPESNQLYCLLPMGYPVDRQGPVNRKPVSAVVYNERFGEAWAFAGEQPDEGWGDRWLG
ncbi:MAG TPA: nitroreductase family protein [Tepidiformaceae bacterium]|nr:nitroreductase family protein [Tepidiformaceae bacterium]